MSHKTRILDEVPDCIRPIKASLVAALALGITAIGPASAQEPKVAGPRASIAKTVETRPPAKPSTRPRTATQKLMRNPWEKPDLNREAMASHYKVSNEALPYFYW
jgi:hypothetical protein